MREDTKMRGKVCTLALAAAITICLGAFTQATQFQEPNNTIAEESASEIIYHGQVIDGLTGEPLDGAFILAPGVLRPNLGFITEQQWAALRRLPPNPPIDSPAIDCIRKPCKSKAITRTAKDGQFTLTLPGDFWNRNFYGMDTSRLPKNALKGNPSFLVFDQHYLPFYVSHGNIQPSIDGRMEIVIIKLSPCATVIFEPQINEPKMKLSAHWCVEKDSPFTRSFPHYRNWASFLLPPITIGGQNGLQHIQIPANVDSGIFITRNISNKNKCPIKLGPFKAEQGQSIDLGKIYFDSEINVYVQVTDVQGNPVENIRVVNNALDCESGALDSALTNEDGFAQFTIPANYWGTFTAICKNQKGKTLKHPVAYETTGKLDANKTFAIELPDETIQAMADAQLHELFTQKKENTKELAKKVLDDKEIAVRVYNNWRNDKRSYELVNVEVAGLSINKQHLYEQMPEIDRFAVIIVTPHEQQDQAVLTLLGNRVLAGLYSDKQPMSLWPEKLKEQTDEKWKITDILGNSLSNAEIEIALEYNVSSPSLPRVGRIYLMNVITDQDGLLPKIGAPSTGWNLALIMKNPKGGRVYLAKESEDLYIAPLLQQPTTKPVGLSGFVVDDKSLPVENVIIRSSAIKGPGGESLGTFPKTGHKAITNEQGKFALAMMTKKGTFPPPDSYYSIAIDPPDVPGSYYRYGYIPIDKTCTISMKDFPAYFHTFAFETKQGLVTDEETLEKICIEIQRNDTRKVLVSYHDFKEGIKLPPGTYKASIRERRPYYFQLMQVTSNSPEQLVFQMQQEQLYQGRVVHALTGKPIPFALVMAGSYRANVPNFNSRDQVDASIITPQQWQDIRELPAEITAAHPTLDPFRKFCRPAKIVRADSEGRFSFIVKPDSGFYEYWALEENFLPCIYPMTTAIAYKDNQTTPADSNTVKLPTLQLVPAAKISLEPYVEGLSEPMSLCIRLNVSHRPCPQAIKNLKRTWEKFSRDIQANKPCDFLVPAGTQSMLELLPNGNPKNVPYRPVITMLDIPPLTQGQNLDLGRQPLGPKPEGIVIYLKVVDTLNRPVPNLGVWCDPHHKYFLGRIKSSDKNGLIEFTVPNQCKGTFVVTTNKAVDEPDIRQTMSFEIIDQSDQGAQFVMRLSNKMYNLLFR